MIYKEIVATKKTAECLFVVRGSHSGVIVSKIENSKLIHYWQLMPPFPCCVNKMNFSVTDFLNN
jgi:hypothetical protein